MFGGKIMDTFIDKITGKFSSGDVIKANAEAEAKQLEAYKARTEELEKAVSDMRRLNLKCVETNEATGQLVQGAIEKIEEIRGGSEGIDAESLEKILTELSALKESVDSNFKKAEEESHKENVRVYRNVQAAVVDELKQQSEAIALQHMHIEKKLKGIKPIAIIALVFSGLNFCAVVFGLVIWILSMGL